MKKIGLFLFLVLVGFAKANAQFVADLAGFPLVTTGWTIGGSAVVVDSTVRLTAPTTNQSGYVYYATPVNLTGCGQFTVDFDYKVVISPASTVADGIAFWYISNPPTGFTSGGGIGLPTFANGLIMIMDTYDNAAPVNVPLATLLGYNGTIMGYTEGSSSGVLGSVAPFLSYITDGTWRHCKITYNVGAISVYFNYSATATLTGTYPLSISGYFGFSSSTGAAYSTQSVKNVHITAVTALDPPDVTSPVTYCQYDTPSPLSATPDGTATLYWYTTDTATVVSLPGAPTPSTATPGTYTWYVRQKSGTCTSPPDSIKVIVNPKPAPPTITGDTFYCKDALFNPFTVTGSSILWYTAATGGTGSSTAPTVPTATAGNYAYYASQTLLGCESDRDSIKVRVHPLVSPPTVTGTTTYCQYVPWVPLTATGTNILWYPGATGGTGVAIEPTINTNVAGTYNQYVTQSDSGCESARNHITITVNARPAAPGTAPISYCQNTTAVPLTATGTGLTWYGPGPTAGTSTAPTPSTTTVGTTTYYVTQTVSGCTGDSASLTVTILPAPAMPVTSSNSPVCEHDTIFLHALSSTSGVTYDWIGPLSFASTSPDPVILDGSPSMSGPYIVTVALGTCTVSATVMVTVTPTPALLATSNTPICSGDSLKLYADVGGPGGAYSWVGPYTFSSGAQNPYRELSVPEFGGVYTVTVLYNGCTAVQTTTVVVNEVANPPMMAKLTYCQYYPAWPLQAFGDNILWYPSATPGGVGSATPPVPQTANIGSTYYYASQTVNGCKSIIDSMLVVVNPMPHILDVTPSSITVCPRESASMLIVDTEAAPTYRWYPDTYLDDTTRAQVNVKPETDIRYMAVLANIYGCKDSAYVDVKVRPGGIMTIPDSVTIYPGESYQILPQTNCANFNWSPAGGLNNRYISNPIATPEMNTRYIVTASTEWGCTIKDTILVYVSDEPLIDMPNAFAPGSANSEFKLVKRGIAVLRHFRVYDRWGVVVFESKDIDKGWDGTYKGVPQPFGVYVYEFSAVSMSGKEFVKKGNVTLVR